MKNKRGSEWKKWDLHIHSKYSLEDSSKLEVKEIFENAIDNNVSVISITDHSNVDALDEIWSVWEKNIYKGFPIKDQIDFLPGIEMRTNRGKHSVHTLVVFPKLIKEKKIDKNYIQSNFLNPLKFTNTKIEEIGNGSYKTGLLKICTDFEELSIKTRELGGILFIHAGGKSNSIEREIAHETNNAEEYELLSSLGTEKEKIMKEWVDVCELPNYSEKSLNEKKFYLEKFNKPSVIFSDSHESYDKTKFTWIKADPTFEGLKQIIYEPEDRLYLGQENPYSLHQKIFINNIIFSGSKNFIIPDIEIPLNRELVTIIGGRGGGKSALLESIAFLNEEHLKEDQNKKKKIIEHYRQNTDNKEPAPGFSISFESIDKDGNTETKSKQLDEKDNLGLPFLYIGQEQLSSLATNDIELTKKICDLLNIDTEQFKQSNLLDDAREFLLKIENITAEIKDITNRYPEYKNGDFIEWIDKYVSQREEQKKKLSSKTTRNLLEEISNIIDKGLKLKDYKSNLEYLIQESDSIIINKSIDSVNKTDKELYKESSKEIPHINLSIQKSAILSRIKKIDEDMKLLRDSIVEKKKTLALSGLKEDIGVLMTATESIQREINNATRDKEKHKETNKKLLVFNDLRNKFYNRIGNYLKEIKNKIDDGFEDFIKSRVGSKEEELILFNKIIDGVGVEGKIIFNQENFCSHILNNCVDKRTIKTVEDVKSLIAGKDKNGKAMDIDIDSLNNWIESKLSSFLASDTLKTDGEKNLVNYLFTEWGHFTGVKSVVKLKGVSTEKLSVGQRGTLLLKIYLATASVKQIFIVDQPEDNLDNQFIMNELVPLIREIKKSRQIIISTHNANLVVNADSEQIIVARLDDDKYNDYVSGGIENPLINLSIKNILEGGEIAFRKRENKYRAIL